MRLQAFEQSFSITDSEIVEGDIYHLNGTKITIGATTTVAGVAALVNAKSDEIGLKATVNGNNLVLSGDNVQSLTINNESAADQVKRPHAVLQTRLRRRCSQGHHHPEADIKGRTIKIKCRWP